MNSQAGTPTPLKRQGTFSVRFGLDYSGLLGIAKAGDGKLLIKLVKSTKVADKVHDKVGAAAPIGSVRRNNVTRPGNIDDYRCPRRNIVSVR